MKTRARTLLEKALNALISAIEIYNKPVFDYREETFAILAVNAWEILLKARILQLSSNKVAAILEYEKRRRADGSWSDKLYRKRNRAGNFTTVGLFKAADLLANDFAAPLPLAVRKNLEALVEIRDNAVHFANKELVLVKVIHEVGSANVRNFVSAARQWFGDDLSDRRLFLMPLAFVSGSRLAEGLSLNAQEEHLAKYLSDLRDADAGDVDDDYSVALTIEFSLKRSKSGEGSKFSISSSPDAVPVRLEEADVRDSYPWDYWVLTKRLQRRYEDFKINKSYHDVRKQLEADQQYCKERLLDPGKPDGQKKRFYNPNIVRAFDAHYTRLRGQQLELAAAA